MRPFAPFAFALLALTSGAAAQETPADEGAPPAGFAEIEIARSKSCVAVIARMDDLNTRLQPLGERAERLGLVSQAIALEDRGIMEELDQSDPTEKAVHDWFVADGRLAQSFVDTQNGEIQRQRAVAREGIKGTVQAEIEEIQGAAREVMGGSEDISGEAAPCDGAIFVRPAVLEACATQNSPVCDPAQVSTPDSIYRFVDSPEDLWDVQELRPWTQPGRLQVGANGLVGGARTVAFARHGNIVLSVGFAPFIQRRADMEEEDVQLFQAVIDTIGFNFDHPDLIFAPALVVRATLPEAIAGEEMYVLHFGGPDGADVVWSAPANTGAPLEAPAVLAPGQVVRLQNGEPLTLTAITTGEDGETEALFSLALTVVNQVSATRTLLGYMATQMNEDLKALVPPGGGS